MAINTSKVVAGGLAAGLVLNVVGFITNGLLLGERMMAEMNAVAPGLADRMATPMVMVTNIVSQFIIGIALVWLYAAMRPRFGPGMRTATYAALVVWVFGFLFYMGWLFTGMMSATMYTIVSAIMLVTLLVASWVGGRIYTEESSVPVTA